ncbi:hypothetical protein D3C77_812530 [compost metagenome]
MRHFAHNAAAVLDDRLIRTNYGDSVGRIQKKDADQACNNDAYRCGVVAVLDVQSR